MGRPKEMGTTNQRVPNEVLPVLNSLKAIRICNRKTPLNYINYFEDIKNETDEMIVKAGGKVPREPAFKDEVVEELEVEEDDSEDDSEDEDWMME